ncbi:MAG: histidine kinase [Actinobacteria bacterium]|nr:histidine kinase [Actinomycetota bacterium]
MTSRDGDGAGLTSGAGDEPAAPPAAGLTTVFARLSAPGDLDLDALAAELAAHWRARSVAFVVARQHRFVPAGVFPGRAADLAEVALRPDAGVIGLVAATGTARALPADSPRDPGYRRMFALAEGESLARLVAPSRDLDSTVRAVLNVCRVQPFTEGELMTAQAVADALGLRLQTSALRDTARDRRTDRDRQIAQAVATEEAERRRLAYDLHDGVATALASGSFHLASAELSLGADAGLAPVREQVHLARDLVDLAYDQTRSAITGLHSLVLSDLGLVAAVESLARATPGVAVQVLADPPEAFADLPAHTAGALHRIAAEALRNVAKHAHASTAAVSLRRVGDVVLLGCSDDGVGFEVADARAEGPGHYGLTSITERCALIEATLRIESLPGLGTTVIVEAPVG